MYLHLSFQSASIILTRPSTKGLDDVVIKKGISENRPVLPVEEVLIPTHCVINMMHVLCGLPPVPYYRQDVCEFKWDEEIVNAVENGLIRYDFDPNLEIVKTEKGFYYKCISSEMFQSKKVKINSENIHTSPIRNLETNKSDVIKGIHTWSSWRRYLGYELFGEVVKYFEMITHMDYTEMKQTYDLIDVLSLLTAVTKCEVFEELCVKVLQAKKTTIHHALNGRFEQANFNRYFGNYPYMVVNGVKSKVAVDGGLLIELTDNMLDMIKSADGVATLLDGGVIKIVDLTDDIDNSEKLAFDGWIKIGSK